MRLISEQKALERLGKLRSDLRVKVAVYEHRAKSCVTCETQGACCLDAHFVNVHISRLEAVAINRTLTQLPQETRDAVIARLANAAVTKYGLGSTGETFDQKYACPLFEKGTGCLVHETGKPVACTMHACYEDQADLPPSELQAAQELSIDRLNQQAYATPQPWLPIPLAIRR